MQLIICDQEGWSEKKYIKIGALYSDMHWHCIDLFHIEDDKMTRGVLCKYSAPWRRVNMSARCIGSLSSISGVHDMHNSS